MLDTVPRHGRPTDHVHRGCRAGLGPAGNAGRPRGPPRLSGFVEPAWGDRNVLRGGATRRSGSGASLAVRTARSWFARADPPCPNSFARYGSHSGGRGVEAVA